MNPIKAYIDGVPRSPGAFCVELLRGVFGLALFVRIVIHVLGYSAATDAEPSEIHPLDVEWRLTPAACVTRDARGHAPDASMDWFLRIVTAGIGCLIVASTLVAWVPPQGAGERAAAAIWLLQGAALCCDPVAGAWHRRQATIAAESAAEKNINISNE